MNCLEAYEKMLLLDNEIKKCFELKLADLTDKYDREIDEKEREFLIIKHSLEKLNSNPYELCMELHNLNITLLDVLNEKEKANKSKCDALDTRINAIELNIKEIKNKLMNIEYKSIHNSIFNL